MFIRLKKKIDIRSLTFKIEVDGENNTDITIIRLSTGFQISLALFAKSLN